VFDINDPSSSRIIPDNKESRLVDGYSTGGDSYANSEPVLHPLDSDESMRLWSTLISYYRQELERQAFNRSEQAKDAAYYDNDQWTDEEKEILRERGQTPIAYNVIAQTCNWVIGSEKRGRTDFKILPRNKDDAKPAESKTKLLKYLSDVNRDAFHKSSAFEDMVKVGVGWLERGAQDADDEETIYCRTESWRNMLFDSMDRSIDGKGMRYVMRSRWLDEDIAIAYFPDREAAICNSVTAATTVGSYDMLDGDIAMDQAEWERENVIATSVNVMTRRKRVRLIEMWYRMPKLVEKMSGGMFDGEDYVSDHAGHRAQLASGAAHINRRLEMRVHVAVMTTSALLYNGKSPYKHNRFPFTPVWGYRRDDNGLPYGVIRGLRDIQDDINKRASKALAILSNNKTIMDVGALPDDWTLDDFADEVAKPNAILQVNQGKRLELNVDRDLAVSHMELFSRNIQMVQQVGGVTDEQMGKTTNATSGKAILARQDQGSLSTAKLFDNQRLATQLDGEIALALCEQYITEQKEFRITNMRGAPDFVTINDGLPENDITRSKADFIISEADWRVSMRQAASEQLGDMISKMDPQIALIMLDLWVDSMDIENRDELVKRIRSVNGMRDPDETEPTQQEIAAQQQQQAQQAQQQQMVQLQMEEQQAKTDLAKANAAKHQAGADLARAQTVSAYMMGAGAAMTAATQVIQMPTIAKVADGLLVQAGWPTAVPVPMNMPAAAGVSAPPNMQAAAPAAPPQIPMPEQAPPQPSAQPPMQPPMQPGA
jgi:hypothetical protein